MPRCRTADAQPAPHSWSQETWPPSVFPHSPGRARYVLRSNRDALLAAGALARVGRQIVILGAPYTRWLESQSRRVDEWPPIAPNRAGAKHHAAAA